MQTKGETMGTAGSESMKRRIAVWGALGFVAACCWLLYVFLTPREQLSVNLREPAVQALAVITCPITLASRYLNMPLSFWAVAAINVLTYAANGTIVETVRHMLNPKPAV
jgi:hypothetical protein